MTRRASVRLQVFDGFLCPLVFREEVEGMTGEKRVVRVGVPEPACAAAGEAGARGISSSSTLARACASAPRSDGRVPAGSDANAPAALTSATNATEAVLPAAPRAHPALDLMTSAEMSG